MHLMERKKNEDKQKQQQQQKKKKQKQKQTKQKKARTTRTRTIRRKEHNRREKCSVQRERTIDGVKMISRKKKRQQ